MFRLFILKMSTVFKLDQKWLFNPTIIYHFFFLSFAPEKMRNDSTKENAIFFRIRKKRERVSKTSSWMKLIVGSPKRNHDIHEKRKTAVNKQLLLLLLYDDISILWCLMNDNYLLSCISNGHIPSISWHFFLSFSYTFLGQDKWIGKIGNWQKKKKIEKKMKKWKNRRKNLKDLLKCKCFGFKTINFNN